MTAIDVTAADATAATAAGVTQIAIVGLGKIAVDQHVPSIARSPAFHLAATVSRNARAEGVDAFDDLPAMLAARPGITAVALCVPPQVRFALAREALLAGRDVLLEKPPGASLAEVAILSELAAAHGRVLYATWHSRHAAGVGPARDWLADRRITGARIVWREDVRRWHPGQDWIWQAGGLGVFDPGINALSVLTEILPDAVRLRGAELAFPSNRDTPIAARLDLVTASGAGIDTDFDWRQTGPQTWDITIETDDGTLELTGGGAQVRAGGEVLSSAETLASEYDGIYARFADLIASRRADVDMRPQVLVADAFMLGRRVVTDAFED